MTWLEVVSAESSGGWHSACCATAAAAVLLAPAAAASPESDAERCDQPGLAGRRRRRLAGGRQGRRRLPGRRRLRPELQRRQDLLHPGHRRPPDATARSWTSTRRSAARPTATSAFPPSTRCAGLVGPDSRNTTFSASDKPGHLLDAGHRRVGGARCDQRRLGQARRLRRAPSACPPATRPTTATSSRQKFTGGRVSYDTRHQDVHHRRRPTWPTNSPALEVPYDATTAINAGVAGSGRA